MAVPNESINPIQNSPGGAEIARPPAQNGRSNPFQGGKAFGLGDDRCVYIGS